MEKLPKDLLCLIALKFDEYDIENLCNTNMRMTECISRNEMFWMNKIIIARPNFLLVLKDKVKFQSCKLLYNRLINRKSNNIYKWQFGEETVNVLGDLKYYIDANLDFKSEYLAEFFSDDFTKENWLLHTAHGVQILVVNSFKEVMEMAIEEIGDWCTDQGIKQKTINRYYETFEKHHKVEIDVRENHSIVKIERIDVV